MISIIRVVLVVFGVAGVGFCGGFSEKMAVARHDSKCNPNFLGYYSELGYDEGAGRRLSGTRFLFLCDDLNARVYVLIQDVDRYFFTPFLIPAMTRGDTVLVSVPDSLGGGSGSYAYKVWTSDSGTVFELNNHGVVTRSVYRRQAEIYFPKVNNPERVKK